MPKVPLRRPHRYRTVISSGLAFCVAMALFFQSATLIYAQKPLTPEKKAELKKLAQQQLDKQLKGRKVTPEQRAKMLEAIEKQLHSLVQSSPSTGTPKFAAIGSTQFRAAFRDVVANASKSTVLVQCAGKATVLGTVVGQDGWILTKASELKEPIRCVLKDGRRLTAKIVGIHEKTDLAMLKIAANGLLPIQWNVTTPQVGDWVATADLVTSPTSVGVISVHARKIARPGGFLGIGLEESDAGPKVTQVMPGSAASKAKMKTGDIVLSVDGRNVKKRQDLINLVRGYNPGDVLTVIIKRGKETITIKPKLGTRGESGRSAIQNRMGGKLSKRRSGFPLVLQHDTVLAPHQCGGPLIDLTGKAVGINIARAGRTASYALPREIIVALLPDFKSGKLAPPTALAKSILTAEKQVAAAIAAIQQSETDLKKSQSELNRLLSETKSALEKAASSRSTAQHALEGAKLALEKAKAELEAERKKNRK